MQEAVVVKNIGLRGFTVADTAVSFIDGQQGILIYRGYRIEELAESSSFMETAYLLLNGRLPSKQELDEFDLMGRKERNVPDWIYEALKKLPRKADPMDVLQGSVPLLAMDDPDLHDESREANVRMAARLIARIPAVTAAWHRIRQEKEPLAPDEKLAHSANFLGQVTGSKPDDEGGGELDTCRILHPDHKFND